MNKYIIISLFHVIQALLLFAQDATVTVNTDPGAMVYMRAPSGAIVDSALTSSRPTNRAAST